MTRVHVDLEEHAPWEVREHVRRVGHDRDRIARVALGFHEAVVVAMVGRGEREHRAKPSVFSSVREAEPRLLPMGTARIRASY